MTHTKPMKLKRVRSIPLPNTESKKQKKVTRSKRKHMIRKSHGIHIPRKQYEEKMVTSHSYDIELDSVDMDISIDAELIQCETQCKAPRPSPSSTGSLIETRSQDYFTYKSVEGIDEPSHDRDTGESTVVFGSHGAIDMSIRSFDRSNRLLCVPSPSDGEYMELIREHYSGYVPPNPSPIKVYGVMGEDIHMHYIMECVPPSPSECSDYELLDNVTSLQSPVGLTLEISTEELAHLEYTKQINLSVMIETNAFVPPDTSLRMRGINTTNKMCEKNVGTDHTNNEKKWVSINSVKNPRVTHLENVVNKLVASNGTIIDGFQQFISQYNDDKKNTRSLRKRSNSLIPKKRSRSKSSFSDCYQRSPSFLRKRLSLDSTRSVRSNISHFSGSSVSTNASHSEERAANRKEFDAMVKTKKLFELHQRQAEQLQAQIHANRVERELRKKLQYKAKGVKTYKSTKINLPRRHFKSVKVPIYDRNTAKKRVKEERCAELKKQKDRREEAEMEPPLKRKRSTVKSRNVIRTKAIF